MRLVLTGPVVRRRLAVCLAAFFVLFLVLTARLFYLQAIAAEDLQRRAQAQWTSDSVIAPTRGGIYDRNGTALALSATAYTASASPRQVKDAQAFARALAPVLDMEESEIVQKVSDTSKGGVTIKRQLTREAAQQVKTMMLADEESGADVLSGLYLEEESRRYYPMGAFATQLLGLTTIDGVGQAGLESSLNDYLSGKAGSILEEIDGKGREVSYGAREYVPAVDGGSVTLTIDASIQSFAEKAAREAMAVNNAKSVRVLVMQPQTGEILALVCKPDYDLNDPPRDDVETLTQLMRNTVVSDAYEPGSTFKILTAAAALDAGVTSENEGFYCSGSIYVEGGRIRCWGEPHGAETMAEALENSCNPVFVELGLRLGIERFYDYMERFGIGSATGVDIPGEGSGIVIDESVVGRVDLARIGFRPVRGRHAHTAFDRRLLGGQRRQAPQALRRQGDTLRGRRGHRAGADRGARPDHLPGDVRHHAAAFAKRRHRRRRPQRLHRGLPRRRQDRHGAGVRGRGHLRGQTHRLVSGLRAHGRPADRRPLHRR